MKRLKEALRRKCSGYLFANLPNGDNGGPGRDAIHSGDNCAKRFLEAYWPCPGSYNFREVL